MLPALVLLLLLLLLLPLPLLLLAPSSSQLCAQAMQSSRPAVAGIEETIRTRDDIFYTSMPLQAGLVYVVIWVGGGCCAALWVYGVWYGADRVRNAGWIDDSLF